MLEELPEDDFFFVVVCFFVVFSLEEDDFFLVVVCLLLFDDGEVAFLEVEVLFLVLDDVLFLPVAEF